MQQVVDIKEKLSCSCLVSHFRRDDVLIKFFLDLTTEKNTGKVAEPVFSVAVDQDSSVPFMSLASSVLGGIEKEIVKQVNNLIYSLDMQLTNELSEEFRKPLKIVFNRIGGLLFSAYTTDQYKGYWSIDFAIRFRSNSQPAPDSKGVEINAKINAFKDSTKEDPDWVKIAWVEHNNRDNQWRTASGLAHL